MSEIVNKEDEKDPNLNIELTEMNSTESQPTSTENLDLSVDLSEEADTPIEKSATDSAIYPSKIEDQLTSSNLDEAKTGILQDEESPELEGELDGFASEQQLEERVRQLQSQIDAHIFEIDSTLDAIDKAEDRERFDKAMKSIGLDTPRSSIAHSLEEAMQVLDRVGFPRITR